MKKIISAFAGIFALHIACNIGMDLIRSEHSTSVFPEARAATVQAQTDFRFLDYDLSYQQTTIQGWTVIVNRNLNRSDPQLLRRALLLLATKLAEIEAAVPRYPLSRLKSIPFWVEGGTPGLKGMQYHWSAKWLQEHGYNPAKARAVEISSIRDFIEWEPTQPWFIMHELAHGYHDRVLGENNADLISAFDRVSASGLYASVKRNNGATERAYALTNRMEYFAEITEAYFGVNDFFPFNRKDLQLYDRIGFELMERIWR